MVKAIYFDMDGTIADLYAVENWLPMLQASNPYPYQAALPMVDTIELSIKLNKLQDNGWHLGIASWLSKAGTPAYNKQVISAKRGWLKANLPTVKWDEYQFMEYGTPKYTRVQYAEGLLFDDEARNREAWTGKAYDAGDILKILEGLV